MSGTPETLTKVIEVLWRMSPPGPNNLLSAPQFIRIRDLLMSLYANAGEKDRLGKDRLGIALANALRGLGLPCRLPPALAHLSLSAEEAASRLDIAFRQTQGLRRFLCPLDMADRVPALRFGPNAIPAVQRRGA